ncbi:hypothetical protein LA76x_1537 [Lysobacter antibioticus]|uniref:Uncharacterized protein n=1 Tax=Lysobacter antibioticus TaxID=84531 RepID=A0A0S2F8C2_LYSAN|nr:hypothetical protein LA76x_1537 [Lysobacter antibioticus]
MLTAKRGLSAKPAIRGEHRGPPVPGTPARTAQIWVQRSNRRPRQAG